MLFDTLLLHFPNLLPQDFQPWIDPEMVRRAGKTQEQAANEAATSWRNGLKEWGIGPDRLLDLQNAAKFAIYTPGSDSGKGAFMKKIEKILFPIDFAEDFGTLLP